MNRNKRVVSCPNLLPRSNKRLESEISSASVLKEIESQYAKCVPRVLGHPIKLSDLFTAVVIRGGYRAVCEQRLWNDVARSLCLPSACTNSSIGLRRIYYQYLSKYEIAEYPALSENYLVQTLVDFTGTDSIVPDLSRMPATSVERNLGVDQSLPTAGLSHSIHHSYPEFPDTLTRPSRIGPPNQDVTWQHSTIDKIAPERSDMDGAIRSVPGGYTNLNDPARLRYLSELRLAELALESGLPNEVDVALNSLLALSVTPSFTGASTSVRLAQCSNLLNLILATVGIYDDSSTSFVICDPVWRKQTQLNFLRFWHNMIEDREGRLFLRPDVFINADFDANDNSDESNSFVELFAPSTVQPIDARTTCSHISELNEDAETARSLLVATILVNLVTPSPSYSGGRLGDDDDDDSEYDALVTRTLSPYTFGLSAWRENARYIAASPTGLRFAFLASYARHSGLRQLGLQLLSSLRYPLDPPPVPMSLDCSVDWTPLVDSGCRLGDLTLSFLARSILDSNDRASLIAGLTFLSNLAKVPDRANEVSLINGLPSVIWPRLAQLICLPDLAVVCAVLDALRCFTNLGHFACLFAWQACVENDFLEPSGLPLSLLQPLLALLTLEGQAMGSQSLHRIKLMQRHPPPVAPMHSHTQPRHAPLPNARSHVPPPDWIAQNQHHRTHSVMSVHNISRPVLQRVLSQPRVERAPLSVPGPVPPSPYGLGNFVSTPPRPRIDRPSNSPTSMETSPPPTYSAGLTYRPPSGSTSCTGLINLLTATTSPPPCPTPIVSGLPVFPSTAMTTSPPTAITSSASSVVTTPVVSTPNAIPNVGCAKLSSPTPPTSSPSLSELTDRLQMPPPSLPPPSALRRSAKSVQSRPAATTVVGSPPSTSRIKSELPPSPKPLSLPASSAPLTTASESTSVQDPGDARCSSNPAISIQSNRTAFPRRPSVTVDHIKPEVNGPEHDSINSVSSVVVTSASVMNGKDDHSPSVLTSLSENRTKTDDLSTELPKPLVNGELKANLNGDPELDNVLTKVDRSNSTQSFCPTVNGLKPGILQAAMKALREQKLDGSRHCSMDVKPPESEPGLVNGAIDPPEALPHTASKNKSCESELPVNNQFQTGLNGIRKPPVDCPAMKASDVKTLTTILDTNRTSPQDSSSPAGLQLLNGEAENNINNSSNTENSNAVGTPVASPRNSEPTRYWLKRRRRWGSRSRLLTPKRRREHAHTLIARRPSLDSPSKSANATSPLKPLPFHSIPLQDSVLGPSWKPLWSPELGLSMSSTKPTRNEPQSSSTCKTSQDQTAATDKKDPDPVAPIHSGDPDVDTHAANPISTTSDTVSVSPSYLCEWESCSASFEDKSQVSSHVYLTHLATKLADSSSQSSAYIHPALPVRRCCRWRGCSSSSLARAPFALLTHVLDVHCSPMELDAALYRSQSRAQPRLMPVSASSTSSSSAPPSSSSSLSDLQNLCSTVHADMSSSPSGDSSAWTIVRSLEAKQMQLDLWAAQHHFVSANPYSRLPLPILGPNPHHPQTPMVAPPPREGPVTKHLRVSAALVIRNLVTYIEEARTWLLSELPLLSEVVMGCSPSDGSLRTNDASRIVAQCLSICNRTRRNSGSIGPFLPTKPLPDECLPRDLLPLLRTPQSHTRLRRYHGSFLSSSVPRPPVFNVDLDARGS